MSCGDLVQFWWAVDRDGSRWTYGIVEVCGPKLVTIRWESGLRQCLRRGAHDIQPIAPAMAAEMREKLGRQ